MDEDLHVLPEEDVREHEASSECWCQPKIGNKDDLSCALTDREVWVHNRAMDNPQ